MSRATAFTASPFPHREEGRGVRSTIRPLVALALACGGAHRDRTVVSDSTPPRPSDSLALTAPHGVEIWFTDSRSASDSMGRSCVERVMEIRRQGTRIPIPLLYTGQPPVLANDSTILADIWLNCRPGITYLVNLRTGFPTRVVR